MVVIRFPQRGRDGDAAGSHGQTIDVYSAGAAGRDAAPELGPGETEGVAENPEERGVVGDVHRPGPAVDHQAKRHEESSRGGSYRDRTLDPTRGPRGRCHSRRSQVCLPVSF
jgi:hypothetical protein